MTNPHRCDDSISPMPERWAEVPGYEERYQVSDHGRIRSLWCVNGPRKRPFLMKPKTYSKYGHMRVQLWDGTGDGRWFMLHRLILAAFVGPCPDGMECAHLNGNPTDNRPENLQWVTRLENQGHKVLHGTSCRGARHGRAKLTAAQADEIRRRRQSGETYATLARAFGVSPAQARRVAIGESFLTH